MVLKSLSYFDDAEEDAGHFILTHFIEVKRRIERDLLHFFEFLLFIYFRNIAFESEAKIIESNHANPFLPTLY